MIRRILLLVALVAALGASIVVAGNVAQKDKAKNKEVDKELQKEKDKDKDGSAAEAQGLFALDLGGDGGYLGVYLEEVTSERAKELGLAEERGAVVMKVVSGSPAEKAGLKENDVVVSFNGRRVDSVRELQRLLNETPAERTVQIEVFRGGSKQLLATTLAKRSLQGLKLLGPGFDDKFMQQNQESMKKLEQSLKESQEAFKGEKWKPLPGDFGDFTFVNPGEFSFFGGRRLGINAESLTDQLAEFFGVKDGKGVLVVSVDENSAAAKAGIKAGDVIVAVGDEKVDGVRSLLKGLTGKDEGTVPVKIVRNRTEQTVNVTLEKRELPAPKRRAFAYRGRATVI